MNYLCGDFANWVNETCRDIPSRILAISNDIKGLCREVIVSRCRDKLVASGGLSGLPQNARPSSERAVSILA